MKKVLITLVVVLFVMVVGSSMLYSLEKSGAEISHHKVICCCKESGWCCWSNDLGECWDCYIWCGNLGGDIDAPSKTICYPETTWLIHYEPQINQAVETLKKSID